MLKKIVVIFLFSTVALGSFAQREAQYVQYLLNPMAINPAAAGLRETFHLNAILRKQWLPNVQGFPMTQTFSMDGALGKDKNIGLGLQGINDYTSSLNNTAISTNVAYLYRLSETQTISVGIQGGINLLPIIDPVSYQADTKALASAGAGLRYDDDGFWVGISMPEFLRKSFSVGASQANNLIYRRPVFVNAGLNLYANDDLFVKPSILITKYLSQGVGFDVNVEANYMEKYGIGASFRRTQTGYGQSISYLHALVNYKVSTTLLMGLTYSSNVPEAYNGNGRGIFEFYITFEPNPKNRL
jgi:type IX secretion system PorP/SprF family membrane protein